jgi:hypothetical protein
MARTVTRKQKKGIMTIPQLRKSFDHMEQFSTSLLRKGSKDMVAKRKAFQKEWLRVFKRPVDTKAADAYLMFEAKRSGSRKQKGGAALSGAPLDYTDRPGLVQEGPYAAFPAYLDKGLDAYATKFNQDSISSQCGKIDTTPKIASDMGSNEVSQKGGKRGRSRKIRKQMGGLPTLSEFGTALSFRPLLANTPTTALYDAQMYAKGQSLPPSPAPNTANPGYMPQKPTLLFATAATITRDLGKEISS